MYRMATISQGQQTLPKNFEWKGKTFSEVTSLLKKNTNYDENNDNYSVFFKPPPLKIYRREIANVSNTSASRKSSTIQSFEVPGGSIVFDSNDNNCKGVLNTKEFNYNSIRDNYNPCSVCDEPLQGATDSTFVRSHSTQDNARRRVRSGGMNRTKFIANKNNTQNYFSSSSQYLHGRNKTFKQNQFNSLRKEGSQTEDNIPVYASNTIQSCGTDASGNTSYVPIYYKPNNAKFAQQGGVSSSNRLVRLKYDTITDVGASMTKVYGNHTANALAYGVPVNGYTIKDKIGYPNTCSLQFSQANPNGIKQKC